MSLYVYIYVIIPEFYSQFYYIFFRRRFTYSFSIVYKDYIIYIKKKNDISAHIVIVEL